MSGGETGRDFFAHLHLLLVCLFENCGREIAVYLKTVEERLTGERERVYSGKQKGIEIGLALTNPNRG